MEKTREELVKGFKLGSRYMTLSSGFLLDICELLFRDQTLPSDQKTQPTICFKTTGWDGQTLS